MSDSMILVETANLNNSNAESNSKTSQSHSNLSSPKFTSNISSSKTKNSLTLNYGIMSIEDVYLVTKQFLIDKEGTKAVQFSYDDRNMLYVLNKQIKYKKFDQEKSKVGFLDLVGQDRLKIWESLGDLSKEDAMIKYIELVDKSCPLFNVHFEAHKRHLEELEKQRLIQEEEEKQRLKEMSEQKEKKLREEDLKLLEENKKRREEIQRKQIQEALNQQTHPHFKAYAEQQHPNNQAAQEELIKQLQEQHFEQYMNQVYQQQLMHQQQQAEQLRAMRRAQKKQEQQQQQQLLNGDQFNKLSINSETTTSALSSSSSQMTSQNQVNISLITENESDSTKSTQDNLQVVVNNNSNTNLFNTPTNDDTNRNVNTNMENIKSDDEDDDDDDDEDKLPPISAASMLTRKDIKEFKESVRRDNDAIIKVGSGETVTVRVPTHEDGRLIFWEFATDYYDIGFGLYFEWSISPSNNVTVHVSDSSEEEEGDEDEETGKKDIEKGDKNADSNKPPCDEIIPIFRRDCHEEVYAGSHLYPGRGVYLLKFDNSFSLWRSKTLYYRVYYSK